MQFVNLSYATLKFISTFSPTGHLSIVDTNSTGDLYSVLKRNLADKGIPHTDYLSGEELDQKYPGFKFQSADFKGYYEENGKVIMANLALETLRVSWASTVLIMYEYK